MVGVAFALRGTLVVDRGLATAAKERLASDALARGRTAAEIDALSDPGLSARFRQICAALVPEYVQPRDEAIDTLREVTRLAMPAAILTNASGTVAHRSTRALGFSGHVLPAEDIGAKKPSPAAYAALAKRLCLPAANIVYVSADPSDVAAAGACGFVAVFLDVAGAASQRAVAQAHRIETLSGVLPILAGPYSRGMLALRAIYQDALEWRDGHTIPSRSITDNGDD